MGNIKDNDEMDLIDSNDLPNWNKEYHRARRS
jgi:hypothetical protein